jgi:hypothetical protein
VFTARYALSPYIKQIGFVFKGLIWVYVRSTMHFYTRKSSCNPNLNACSITSPPPVLSPRSIVTPPSCQCAFFPAKKNEVRAVSERHYLNSFFPSKIACVRICVIRNCVKSGQVRTREWPVRIPARAFLMAFLVSPGNHRDSVLNQATTASLYILWNSLLIII